MKSNRLGRTYFRGVFDPKEKPKRRVRKSVRAAWKRFLGCGSFWSDDRNWDYNRFNKRAVRQDYQVHISKIPMKIAVFTLTRDRLDYTRHCFETLRQKAGYPFDHYVVDNGSTDGTQDWLMSRDNLTVVRFNERNLGIAGGCGQALSAILMKDYDLVIKFDNDCEVVSPDILKRLVEVYKSIPPFFSKFMLSPRVEGLAKPPRRLGEMSMGDYTIGITDIIGGIFQPMPADCYRLYREDENLPLGRGRDGHITSWFLRMGGIIGYIEDLVVNHYESTVGQKNRFPSYYERKIGEEKTPASTKTTTDSNIQPDVTVVITHRKGESCRDALESLERQTYRRFKKILVEDAEGKGANWARNTGFKAVDTKYVLFSDNDIVWEPDALENMVRTLEGNPEASYAYGGYDLIRDEEVIGRYGYEPWNAGKLRKWKRGNFVSTMSLVRTDHFPGFDEQIKRLMDWDVWLTMLHQKRTGVYCGKRIFVTRFRQGITYGTNSTSWDEAVAAIKRKHQSKFERILARISGIGSH